MCGGGFFHTYKHFRLRKTSGCRHVSVNSVNFYESDIDLTLLELYCTRKLHPFFSPCKLKQTWFNPCQTQVCQLEVSLLSRILFSHLESLCMLLSLKTTFSNFKYHQSHDYNIMFWFTRSQRRHTVKINFVEEKKNHKLSSNKYINSQKVLFHKIHCDQIPLTSLHNYVGTRLHPGMFLLHSDSQTADGVAGQTATHCSNPILLITVS